TTSSDEAIGVEADVSNMETTISASPTPTLRIHKDHPKSQIIGPVDTPIQTRHKSKEVEEQSFIATIYQKTDPSLLQFCLFSCFLSQILVDCPKGVRPIGTKWVLKNKKDERGIVVRNKAKLVAQGHTQEEGIDYDEVFAPVARIEAIRLFLAYASFMGFTVYQMNVKSAFLSGTIDEEDKYIGHILKKFRYSDVRSSNTPMDKDNPWGKDGTGKDVDLHLYRSMIGSLMYLTASRPDIMFDVCAYARHQVTPKESYSDSDYGGASQDRKSTTGGSQFLGRRLISWQCKKQMIVATSTTEAEFVAAASYCGQVLWIQNQLLDYG
nr:ribonuclease H-like domain, reverse transcriptase, RNA-dependent DNA polymerase [Tanacetum cinerariifolium]